MVSLTISQRVRPADNPDITTLASPSKVEYPQCTYFELQQALKS